MSKFISRSAACLFVISALLLAGAFPARTQAKFDGNWSVLIITDAGDCDRAYRYGVRIEHGRIRYEGSVEFSGSVGADGRVSVTVRHGSQSASGTGRLSGDSGNGTWRGNSPTNRCSGRWEAERR